MSQHDTDLAFLRRCVELAREAFDDGDEPFGSLLVDGDGVVRVEDRNRVKDGDETRHPELEVARWSASHLTAEERAASTVYTSGEHCAMCSAAHAWMGLGPIVYAGSTAQLVGWRAAWGLAPSPVLPLAVQEVAPGVPVRGPFVEFEDELRELHHRQAERSRPATPSSQSSSQDLSQASRLSDSGTNDAAQVGWSGGSSSSSSSSSRSQ